MLHILWISATILLYSGLLSPDWKCCIVVVQCVWESGFKAAVWVGWRVLSIELLTKWWLVGKLGALWAKRVLRPKDGSWDKSAFYAPPPDPLLCLILWWQKERGGGEETKLQQWWRWMASGGPWQPWHWTYLHDCRYRFLRSLFQLFLLWLLWRVT